MSWAEAGLTRELVQIRVKQRVNHRWQRRAVTTRSTLNEIKCAFDLRPALSSLYQVLRPAPMSKTVLYWFRTDLRLAGEPHRAVGRTHELIRLAYRLACFEARPRPRTGCVLPRVVLGVSSPLYGGTALWDTPGESEDGTASGCDRSEVGSSMERDRNGLSSGTEHLLT